MSAVLRIAVLDHHGGERSRELAAALETEGAEPRVISPSRIPDAPLRLRKIGEAPGRLPATLAALMRGRWDAAHALSAQDAVAAVVWAQLSGRPAVFSPSEPLTRANVAHYRLRLANLSLAVERSSAVVAHDEETAESLLRWMAVEPRVIPVESGAEHLALYAALSRR